MAKLNNFWIQYGKFNNSKLLSGLAMLILNLFSKYVELNISKSQEAYIRNSITREILIFIVVFVGTKRYYNFNLINLCVYYIIKYSF